MLPWLTTVHAARPPSVANDKLQVLRDRLHSEAARVQREIVGYSNLTEATLQSTNTIAESLEQWRKASNSRLTTCAPRQ